MLLSKNIIESVVPPNLKELINEGNTENLNMLVSNLRKNLTQYRDDVRRLAEDNFKQLSPQIENAENLTAQIHTLHSQISKSKDELEENENSLKSVSELEGYKILIDRIELISKVINIIEHLQGYAQSLDQFTQTINTKNYPECNRLLTHFTTMTHEYNNNAILNEIAVFKSLNEEFTVQRERLWYELGLEWDKLIKIEKNAETNSITIETNLATQSYIDQLTAFSEHVNDEFVFMPRLKQFGKQFLSFCDENLVSSSANNIEIVETGSVRTLRVICNQTESLSAGDLLELKLNQIQEVLKFLNKHLFRFMAGQKCLMSIFSDKILGEFVALIYQKLIVGVIPVESFECRLEVEICEKVGAFERALEELRFLEERQRKQGMFDSFKNNVEELYVRKKCKFVMEQNRELMKDQESLLRVVRVDERDENILDQYFQKTDDIDPKLRQLLEIDSEIRRAKSSKFTLDSLHLLHMQACSISQTAQHTLHSVYATFNEAAHISKTTKSVKNLSLLCLVAKNLLELYACVVPTFHRDIISSLPLATAVVYNDLMLFAFHCLTLGHQFKPVFDRVKKETHDNFTCLDLIPKFYEQASTLLSKQMDKQQAILMQFLNEDSNGLKDLSESNNFDLLKKALNKCTYQLNMLATVWVQVLPDALYLRLFGQLFNLICNNLLKSCLRLEDISSDDASYMDAAFTLVKQSVFEVFMKIESQQQGTHDKGEDLADLTLSNKIADLNAEKYIETWPRFNYLVKVLRANLQEIVEMWSEAKGPLALVFDAEEVRRLIRALFMITDKRSAALAKIK